MNERWLFVFHFLGVFSALSEIWVLIYSARDQAGYTPRFEGVWTKDMRKRCRHLADVLVKGTTDVFEVGKYEGLIRVKAHGNDIFGVLRGVGFRIGNGDTRGMHELFVICKHYYEGAVKGVLQPSKHGKESVRSSRNDGREWSVLGKFKCYTVTNVHATTTWSPSSIQENRLPLLISI